MTLPMARGSKQFMVPILGGSAALLMVALLINRYLSRPRPAPPPPEATMVAPPAGDFRCTPRHYQAVIESDAGTYQVPAPTLDQLGQPLRGGTEFQGERSLQPRGGVLETEHLRIVASIEKLRASLDGSQGFGADHIVLSISNKSAVPVAYRVLTSLRDVHSCRTKADLPHNAIVLRPGETIRRTECVFHKRRGLAVHRVDVYEITELGHRYLSRLVPAEGGPFEMRLARAHDPGGLRPCRSLPWRDLDPSTDPWRAVIDFHARHNCDEYTQPRGYLPLTAPAQLPLCRPTP